MPPEDFSPMTPHPVSGQEFYQQEVDALKAENSRLVKRIEDLERERRSLEELDEMNTLIAKDLNKQASSLKIEIDVLKEFFRDIARTLFASR